MKHHECLECSARNHEWFCQDCYGCENCCQCFTKVMWVPFNEVNAIN